MFWRSVDLKPLKSARTLYVPGSRLGALYAPVSSTVRVRVVPLCRSETVTVAPTTAPPLWSLTAPRIRPALPCEKSGMEASNTARHAVRTGTVFLKSKHVTRKSMETPPRQDRRPLRENQVVG